MTKNHICSVDAHFHDRASRVLQSVLPIKAANIPLLPTITFQRCDFPGLMTKNHRHSVDAHFHDGAGRVLQSVLPIKAANNSFETDYNQSKA
jgi:hypothetical protein